MRKEHSDSFFSELYNHARKVGYAAGKEHEPTPKLFRRFMAHGDFTGSVENEWQASDGALGIAWIVIRPGNCPFGNWLKRNKKGGVGFKNTIHIIISDHAQSYECKIKHAEAMASIFREAGINAYSHSRLDI